MDETKKTHLSMRLFFMQKKSCVAFPQRHFNPNTNRVNGKIVERLQCGFNSLASWMMAVSV